MSAGPDRAEISCATRAKALWVVVVGGLLYGVVNTLLPALDLFTG